MRTNRAYFLVWLALVMAANAADPERGVKIVPVSTVAPGGNAGLFVGVNQFSEDKSLQPLRFAVNDAIAQAHAFVLDLKIVAPTNSYLALSGDPTTDAAKTQLAALQSAGIQRVVATKTGLLRSLSTAAALATGGDDLLIVSLSSHGFEERGHAYVLPSDGLHTDLQETAIKLGTVEQRLAKSKAGKRLLLLDACRENPTVESRGIVDAQASAAFRSALAAAEGQAVLASCDAGQVSLENTDLGHGVFTFFLLDALKGKAAADTRGFITLGAVKEYVAQAVQDWVVRNRPGVARATAQRPWFKGPTVAEQIPLAVDSGIKVRQAEFAKEVQRVLDVLKTKIDRKGEFNAALYEKLAGVLEQATDTPTMRKLLSNCRDFADGKMDAQVFAAYASKAIGTRATPEPSASAPVSEYDKLMAAAADLWAERKSRLGVYFEAGVDAKNDVRGVRVTFVVPKSASEVAGVREGDFITEVNGVPTSTLKALVQEIEKTPPGAIRLQLVRDGKTTPVTVNLGAKSSREPADEVEWIKKIEPLYVQALAQKPGDPRAQACLNQAYEIAGAGARRTKDYTEALKWYRKAADNGHAIAMKRIASMYSGGEGVQQDHAEALRWYRKAADAGDMWAMATVGDMYGGGRGVERDDTESLKWYRKAANAGNPHAMNTIGFMYGNGRGVERDHTEALKWYRKAAGAGYLGAMVNIGVLYSQGLGVEQDYTEALKWYRKAADAGYPGGMGAIGGMYWSGHGVDRDYAEAMKWFRKAADAGDTQAMRNIGVLYNNGHGVARDYAEAMKWYCKAAEAGNAAAMNSIGEMYENGNGVPRNDDEALKWYSKAADEGDAGAMGAIGVMYANGRGVVRDQTKAMKWFRKAAEGGNMAAMRNIGIFYENGNGVERDSTEAAKWYRKAAVAGDIDAMNRIGSMYLNGRGIECNYQEALKWLRKAAAAGNLGAMVDIGFMYMNGYGVERDYQEAVKWSSKAANAGHPIAMMNVGALYRNGQGVVRDDAEAMKWSRKAADAGVPAAMFEVGMMYEQGLGVRRNLSEAINWYRKGAGMGDQRSIQRLQQLGVR